MTTGVKQSWEKYLWSKRFLAHGSSTNSKRPMYEDVEPAMVVRGKGCRVWDLDGNEYIDFRNACGPVSLGYCVPEIDQAIKAQLQNGISFGYPHPLEGEVAELLVKHIPCAERVRFLKTGGEAIAACVKIARGATGREKIVNVGYNGWITAMTKSGVPEAIKRMHIGLPWGEKQPWLDLFADEGDKIAACVIASNYVGIEKGKEFLPFVRELTNKHGVLMIMDEIVTGFRFAFGGVHQYFGFSPDMAVFGKAIANGMPLSAYLGRADLIDMASELFITSTFGGETLSLAAAKATILFFRERDVIGHIWRIGKMLQDGMNGLFARYGIEADMKGYPPALVFEFKDPERKDTFFKHCYSAGISFFKWAEYVNYSHKDADIREVLEKAERVLQSIAAK